MAVDITTPGVPHTAREKEENIVLRIDGINDCMGQLFEWSGPVKGSNNVSQRGLSLTTEIFSGNRKDFGYKRKKEGCELR